MRVAGTPSPLDRMWVTVMPAESREGDMGEIIRGHSAVRATATPFTACGHMYFTVEQAGRSTKSV